MSMRATSLLLATALALPILVVQPLIAEFNPSDNPPPKMAVASTAGTVSRTMSVPGSKQWTDTGIELRAGEKVTFTSEGSILFLGNRTTSPGGLPRGWKDLLRALPVNDAGDGALIGRIGKEGVPFLVGASREITTATGGRLFLGINQLESESSSGEFTVRLAVTRASDAAALQISDLKPSPTLLQGIPRRVEDHEGRKGDLVNFIVIGSKEKLERTFSDAGWVLVDKTKGQAVVDALFQTLQKKPYVEMPMSELYLFGRSQDYGYAHAEPIKVVEQRHHLRLWQSQQTYRGQPIWVGAATHDIGFERDQRKQGAVTHKIDPNIDTEREYVRATLFSSGGIAASGLLTPADPLKETRTATGGLIKTDGRILVLQLR